jgi:hypothetical protein
MQRRQGRQFPVAQAMQAMMVQGQLRVSSLDTGTGSLEQTGAIAYHALDFFLVLRIQLAQGALANPCQTRLAERL